MLMQGLPLPSPGACTAQPLPPARQRPSSPPPTPTHPYTFYEPEDTTGRACVRGSSRQSTPVPFAAQSIVPMPALRNTPVLEQATLPTKVVQLAQIEVRPQLCQEPLHGGRGRELPKCSATDTKRRVAGSKKG